MCSASIANAFLGFILGLASALLVARVKGRIDARARLGALLFKLSDRLYREDAAPFKIFEPLYFEMVDAIWNAHQQAFWWERRTIVRHFNRITGHPEGISRHSRAYPSKQDMTAAIHEFLRFLGCPFKHRGAPDEEYK